MTGHFHSDLIDIHELSGYITADIPYSIALLKDVSPPQLNRGFEIKDRVIV